AAARFVFQPFQEILLSDATRFKIAGPAMPNHRAHAPDFADIAAHGDVVRGVIFRPPRHLIIDHQLNARLFGERHHLFGFVISRRHGLFKHDVNLARRAGFRDFQMAVVFDEGPDDFWFLFVQQFGVAFIYGNAGYQRLDVIAQLLIVVGDADDFDQVLILMHLIQLRHKAPAMGMDQSYDCDFRALIAGGLSVVD